MIVVTANPLNKPAPANHKGSIAATRVAYAENIMKNALLIFSFQSGKCISNGFI